MRLKLDRKWTERLLRLSESGMGYQRVQVRLKDGRSIPDAIVLNADILDVAEPITPFCAEDIEDLVPSAESP